MFVKTNLAVYSAKAYDKAHFEEAIELATDDFHKSLNITFHTFALSMETVALAKGADAVCVFVNDLLSKDILQALHAIGVRGILLRCAGYNNVDLVAAEELNMFVANVPAYSPEAVAEFAVALLQTLNRKTHRAFNRVRDGNFDLQGFVGHTLYGKTVGIVGVGRIGLSFARIMKGFGCTVFAYDPYGGDAFLEYGSYIKELKDLLPKCDVVSLHCPLTEGTLHLINDDTLKYMKPGALLINTSRGALVDTTAAISALKNKVLGGLALDVYEAEAELFYMDHSGEIIHDDELMRLTTFPNVLICGHQAFLTFEALTEIAQVTLGNFEDFIHKRPCKNSLVREGLVLVRRDTAPARS
jgi:D-lactate dehydrogenase